MSKKTFNDTTLICTRKGLPVNSRLRTYVAAILLAATGNLSGCATGRTGTHVEPRLEDLVGIEKVGLSVNVERGFAVRLQYVSNADQAFIASLVRGLGIGLQASPQATGGVAVYATPVGAGIGVGIAVLGEFSPDKRATRSLTSEAAKMKSAEDIGRVLADRFRTTNIFTQVDLLPPPSSAPVPHSDVDALFIVTVKRWGLRPVPARKYGGGDKRLTQVELDVNLKLVSSATREIMWERDELFVDGQCYSVADFKSQEGLLVSRMEHLLQKVCDRTNSEIGWTG